MTREQLIVLGFIAAAFVVGWATRALTGDREEPRPAEAGARNGGSSAPAATWSNGIDAGRRGRAGPRQGGLRRPAQRPREPAHARCGLPGPKRAHRPRARPRRLGLHVWRRVGPRERASVRRPRRQGRPRRAFGGRGRLPATTRRAPTGPKPVSGAPADQDVARTAAAPKPPDPSGCARGAVRQGHGRDRCRIGHRARPRRALRARRRRGVVAADLDAAGAETAGGRDRRPAAIGVGCDVTATSPRSRALIATAEEAFGADRPLLRQRRASAMGPTSRRPTTSGTTAFDVNVRAHVLRARGSWSRAGSSAARATSSRPRRPRGCSRRSAPPRTR